MTPPEPWPEILAAYADGELPPAERAAVERWLAAHPEDRALLRTQRELSPANEGFWAEAVPPLPSPREWAAVRAAIGRDLAPAPAGRRWGWTAAAAAAVVLAIGAAVWVATRPGGPPESPDRPAADLALRPKPEPAPLPPGDDERLALDEALAEPIALAAPGEVSVEAVGPPPMWPAGVPTMGTNPTDNPMIFAAGLR